MRQVCFLLHGFNVNDGGYASVDLIKPTAREFNFFPYDHDYGWVWLFRLRKRNKNVAKSLSALIKKVQLEADVVLVGHSNGCAIIYEMIEKHSLGSLKGVVFINPALHKEIELPQTSTENFVVLFNKHDYIVQGAKWWRRFINVMPLSRMKYGKHLWGSAGQQGFDKPIKEDTKNLQTLSAAWLKPTRVLQMDTSNPMDEKYAVHGHSAIFKDKKVLCYWMRWAFTFIKKEN